MYCSINALISFVIVSPIPIIITNTGLVTEVLGSLFFENSKLIFLVLLGYLHCHVLLGIQEATQILVAILMSRESGYYLHTLLFLHAPHTKRLRFISWKPSSLLINYHSGLTIVHLLSGILVVVIAASLEVSHSRIDSGTLACTVYSSEASPVDRGYPTVWTEMGAAEFLLGDSIGMMRAGYTSMNKSVHVMPPQLTDVALDFQHVIGPGFATDLASNCACTDSYQSFGSFASTVQSLFNNQDNKTIINYTRLDSQRILVTSLLAGFGNCNGSLLLCDTVITNHRQAIVSASIKTDGTPASIAITGAHIRSEGEQAPISYLHDSLLILLGGTISSISLPDMYLNVLNPLLWRGSYSHFQTLSPSKLDAGIETLFAILLKGSIQRSYLALPYSCLQNIPHPSRVLVQIHPSLSVWCFLFLAIQALGLAYCLVCCLLWLTATRPINPAVRLTFDRTFYSHMIARSAYAQYFQGAWQSQHRFPTDLIIAVGESKTTVEEDIGVISIHSPDNIQPFCKGRSYY